MSRILITGASGFLGRHVISSFSTRHEIYALTRALLPVGSSGDVHWIQHDLTRPLDASTSFPAKVDAVIHLAQSRQYRSFPTEVQDIFSVNVASTLHLLDYARKAGAGHFILASTGGLYGTSNEPFAENSPINLQSFIEESPARPLNFYFTSKHFAELLLANYQQFLRPVVLRIFFLYGPGQEGMLIPNMVKKVLRNELITIQGNPGMFINPIFIEDALRAFDAAMHLDAGGIFNVAGDEVVSITGLIQQIASLAGCKPVIQYSDDDNPGNLLGDNKNMKQTLGVFPTVSLQDGLKTMLFSDQER